MISRSTRLVISTGGRTRTRLAGRNLTEDGDLVCPTCGGVEFSARITDEMGLVLSCWKERTHIRLTTANCEDRTNKVAP